MHRWFTAAVFVGAALLFTVEPLTGRLVLPLAGGTPAVWTTCLLFFQAALLAGYAYAHAIGDRLPIRSQILLHVCVIILPVLTLPVVIDKNWFAGSEHPTLTLLPMLARMVGLPFFALATTAPLMQMWFASVAPKRDPYPLYAASNAGSLLALAAYPFVIEPMLGLIQQGVWWTAGYGIYAAVILACAVIAWKAPASVVRRVASAPPVNEPWMRWILLSFAPSSLLMGTTTAITMDIAPIPLLWVVPLAIYLLTFIMAFAGRKIIPHWLAVRVAPVAVLAVYMALLTGATKPWWAILAIHLFAFFFVSLACHGELNLLRPSVDRLTRYYLLISVGGVLGGVLNALIAPVVFQKVGLAEYPIVFAVAMALLPNRPRAKAFEGIPELTGAKTLVVPAMIGGAALGLVLLGRYQGWISAMAGSLIFGVPLLATFFLVDRPRRFAVSLLLVWLAGRFYVGDAGELLFFERNFFGTIRVCREHHDGAHILIHGSTLHGRQKWKDGHGVNEPLAYYGRLGPVGQLFEAFKRSRTQSVAACGLGAGSIAAYAKPEHQWTFYDIDPGMIEVAKSPALFTFLHDNFPDGKNRTLVLGDARLEMAKAKPQEFGLIILDAFSSDSIPVHLLTREAMQMYLEKLAPDGVIAFHISNRYLDLKPVLSSVALEMNLVARYCSDKIPLEYALQMGLIESEWVALSRKSSDLGDIATNRFWDQLAPPPRGFRTWTDDYSNLLSVFMFDHD